MTGSRKLLVGLRRAGHGSSRRCGRAAADGYEVCAPRPPVDEGRKFTYSFNIGATSDYVFRGISQSDNDPAIQGGIDFGYGHPLCRRLGIGRRFRRYASAGDGLDAQTEIDWYGGIKPTWNVAALRHDRNFRLRR